MELPTTPRTRAYASVQTRHIRAVLALASCSDIEQGLVWYKRAASLAWRLSTTYGFTFEQCAAVIAALSPNNKWERNTVDADTVCAAYRQGLSPSDIKVGTFHNNKAKAWACLEITDPTRDKLADILHGKAGRKVRSFYHSIIGQNDDVCIDGHAYSIWLGRRISTSKTPAISAKAYELAARSYVLAAEGTSYTPAQVQAITWTTWRRLFGGTRA